MPTSFKWLSLLGALLLFGSVLIWLGVGFYILRVWWELIEGWDPGSFALALVLFPATIPLAPLYAGVQGDWDPLLVTGAGMVSGLMVFYPGFKISAAMENFRRGQSSGER